MGLAGKILAVFNVLAAIGFLTVAVMDYGKQRAWATLIFQEELLRVGLPVTDQDLDENGEVIAKKVGTYTQQQLGTSQPPVTTQVAEVQQRQSALQSAITGAGTEREQKEKLATILLPLATSFGEREALKQRIAKESIDELMGDGGPFKSAFREALEAKTLPTMKDPNGSDTPRNIDDELRRQAIAHLLFNLGDKAQDYNQRLQGIIGLEAFLKEVASQLIVNKRLLDSYETAIHNESLPFEVKHRDLMADLIASAGHLQEQIDALQKQETSRDTHRTLVGKRKEDLAILQAKLDVAQKHLNVTLARQKELEVALDKANSEAAAMTEANKSLEKQIRSREIGR
ncbi:hypothetical protein BH10PLA2_BH10PLA2_22160 [soil metagenome]